MPLHNSHLSLWWPLWRGLPVAKLYSTNSNLEKIGSENISHNEEHDRGNCDRYYINSCLDNKLTKFTGAYLVLRYKMWIPGISRPVRVVKKEFLLEIPSLIPFKSYLTIKLIKIEKKTLFTMVSGLQPLLRLAFWTSCNMVCTGSPKVLLTSSQKFFCFITSVCNLEF